MELITKPDWPQAEDRMAAWWQREVLDRPVVQVKAPRAGVTRAYLDSLTRPWGVPPDQIHTWYTDPDQVIPRCEKLVNSTFWGGEAFPVVFPVSISLVGIVAAYLGCPYYIHPESHTGWAAPIIDDWTSHPSLAFDPGNEWWRISHRLLDAAAQAAPGRYYVGVPDLNAPGQIVALLREMQRFAIDLLERPAAIKQAISQANTAWLRYWQAANGAIHQWIGGYFYWMGIWSDQPSTDLQCDFNVLISSQMFDEFFLPHIEQQTRWVERTIFHLDGPGAIRHLDSLLSLPLLDGIQWVPGDGKPAMSKWLPLLRRIQSKGRLLVLSCEPGEVEVLLRELEPEGLLLSTACDSEDEAKDLLAKVPGWATRRYWTVA